MSPVPPPTSITSATPASAAQIASTLDARIEQRRQLAPGVGIEPLGSPERARPRHLRRAQRMIAPGHRPRA